jgi:hypothetical protein
MKYLIPIALLLALCTCEKNSSAPQDEAASVEKLSYLDKPLKGKVSQRGLYKLVRSDGVIDDPNTGTGKAVSNPVVQQVKSTERIPLIKGAQMYLQYRIWPLPDRPRSVELRRVLKHPEMTLPDGRVSTGSDYKIKGKISSNQAIGYTGYGLDEEYELVEGDWVFELWYQDKKLINQTFTTYWPDKEEIAALEPYLSPGKKVRINSQSADKPFSRMDWPRITVGETKSPELTESLKEPSGNSD